MVEIIFCLKPDIKINNLTDYLKKSYSVAYFFNLEDFLNSLSPGVTVVVIDIRFIKDNNYAILKKIKAKFKIPPVILTFVTKKSEKFVFKAMQEGVFDYIKENDSFEHIMILLNRAIDQQALIKKSTRLQQELEERYSFDNIIGVSPAMQRVYEIIEKVAEHDVTVLITGESGTGKELVAHALHYHGPRKEMPFIKLNCAAIPGTLLESELFGYEKGAFTGAYTRKPGKFEVADKGTIFLDEIGDMSLEIQAKILRIIEHGEMQRLGGKDTIKVDVRIIAATHRDLNKMIEEGLFREDLYYRLNVVNIQLEPLRERKEDIISLVTHFLSKYCKKFNKKVLDVSLNAIDVLMKYNWPGNVRELENTIERAVVLCKGDIITAEDLLLPINKESPEYSADTYYIPDYLSLTEAKEEFEKQFILKKLKKENWNISRTSRLLRLERSNLYRKMKKYGIDKRGF